jgi:ATP-binding cassette subfamily B protein
MKMRTHDGALARFYLDGLLGLSPIRTHGAERSVAREHEALVVEWSRSVRAMIATYVTSDLVQSLVGTLLAIALLFRYVRGSGDPSGVILLMYWALALPSLGQGLGLLVRQVPGHRNTALRVLEPLGALEEEASSEAGVRTGPIDLRFEEVGVVASGHTILDEVDLEIGAGEHVAIVGASGAGKSTLIGLLLGWHRASSGAVLVNGAPLETMRATLRASTAWVDPAVQLWNRPLVENLLYGADREAPAILSRVIATSELVSVLEKLPDGMQTALGESGGLVSGGEGQRVRLARGLLRKDAGLVLLDEPFRGLDRDQRKSLLAATREWWRDATLLCVTHDVISTKSFGRVLVIEGGKIIEDGAPDALLAEDTRYRAMVDAEEQVLSEIWGDPTWRRLEVVDGRLLEQGKSSGNERDNANERSSA